MLSLLIKNSDLSDIFPVRALSVCKYILTNDVLMGRSITTHNSRVLNLWKSVAATQLRFDKTAFKPAVGFMYELLYDLLLKMYKFLKWNRTSTNMLLFTLVSSKWSSLSSDSDSCDTLLTYSHTDVMLDVFSGGRVSWIGCMWSAFLTHLWKSTPSPGYRRFTHTKVRVDPLWHCHFSLLLCKLHLNPHRERFSSG